MASALNSFALLLDEEDGSIIQRVASSQLTKEERKKKKLESKIAKLKQSSAEAQLDSETLPPSDQDNGTFL